jgi:hypothetical protein
VQQELTSTTVSIIAKNGALGQNMGTTFVFSKILRLSAESLKKAVFGAGE